MRALAGLVLAASICANTYAVNTPYFPKPVIVAHMAHGYGGPENSLEAIKRCVEHGVTHIEIDIRYTKDHIPVLMHDASLKRMTGDKRRVDEYTVEEISHVHYRHSTDGIPTLDQVLEQYGNAAQFHLHIKEPDLGPAVAVVAARNLIAQEYFLLTMDEHYVQAEQLHAKYADMRVIPCIRKGTRIAEIDVPYGIAAIDWKKHNDIVRILHDQGKIISGNILPKIFQKMQVAGRLRNGIDIIQTDNPRAAMQVIQQYEKHHNESHTSGR